MPPLLRASQAAGRLPRRLLPVDARGACQAGLPPAVFVARGTMTTPMWLLMTAVHCSRSCWMTARAVAVPVVVTAPLAQPQLVLPAVC